MLSFQKRIFGHLTVCNRYLRDGLVKWENEQNSTDTVRNWERRKTWEFIGQEETFQKTQWSCNTGNVGSNVFRASAQLGSKSQDISTSAASILTKYILYVSVFSSHLQMKTNTMPLFSIQYTQGCCLYSPTLSSMTSSLSSLANANCIAV